MNSADDSLATTANIVALREELGRSRVPDEHAGLVEDFARLLADEGYIIDPRTTIGIYSAIRTRRPLLFVGVPGCGKTFFGEVATRLFNPGEELLMVSMHSGVRPEDLVYREDPDGRRVLWERIRERAAETGEAVDWEAAAREVHSRIVPGPLLTAIEDGNRTGRRRVLVIDEIDKAREETEAPLLDLLNSSRVTVPYVGVFRSEPGTEPIVVLTANKLRRLGEPLESRVFAVEVTLPTVLEEDEILRRQVPDLDEDLRGLLLIYTHRIRDELAINPVSIRNVRYIAEALALLELDGEDALTAELLLAYSGYYAKTREDLVMLRLHVADSLLWARREIARTGSIRNALDGIDALQRSLRDEGSLSIFSV